MGTISGKTNHWSESALEAASLAEVDWVRLMPNMSSGSYDVYRATGKFPEPEWPKLTFNELLRIAFRNRIIEDFNHPVLQKLRGEL